jgi:hypothetical protein
MYTSGRTVKTRKPQITTVAAATRDARRCVEQTIPGVGATVTSRTSWDLEADVETVSTTVTFPRGQRGATGLALLLADLPGVRTRIVADASVTIIRSAG